MDDLRLPRLVEEEPGASNLMRELTKRARPLGRSEHVSVAQADAKAPIRSALQSCRSAGRVVRGLEAAEKKLASERRGLAHVDRKTGVARGGRISRLLVLANDGSNNFYREVEWLLEQHHPRVLALRLSLDQKGLGELLFGGDQVARLVLLEHKDAVSAVLLALAAQWREEPRRESRPRRGSRKKT